MVIREAAQNRSHSKSMMTDSLSKFDILQAAKSMTKTKLQSLCLRA